MRTFRQAQQSGYRMPHSSARKNRRQVMQKAATTQRKATPGGVAFCVRCAGSAIQRLRLVAFGF